MTTTTDGTDEVEAPGPTAEPLPLVDLTDEEVCVLAGTGGVVVLPHLGGLSKDHRDVATATAYRSMVARGMLEAPTTAQAREAERDAVREDSASVAYPVSMPENLAHLLRLRAGADVVVCVAVSTALGQEFGYAHVVDDVALLEEVTGTGLHRFALLDGNAVTGQALRWALHPEATPGHGEEVVRLPSTADDDPTPPDELLERLGAALVRADVVVRRADDDREPEMLGIFSGPAGTYTCLARLGSLAPVVTRPSAPEQVAELIDQLVSGRGPR